MTDAPPLPEMVPWAKVVDALTALGIPDADDVLSVNIRREGLIRVTRYRLDADGKHIVGLFEPAETSTDIGIGR